MPFAVDSGVLDRGVRVISIRGELDLETAPGLEREIEKLEPAEASGLLIDLVECEFIDSTGLALLVRAWKLVDANASDGGAGRMVICCPAEQVRRVLEVTGLDSSIPVRDSREETLAELSAVRSPN